MHCKTYSEGLRASKLGLKSIKSGDGAASKIFSSSTGKCPVDGLPGIFNISTRDEVNNGKSVCGEGGVVLLGGASNTGLGSEGLLLLLLAESFVEHHSKLHCFPARHHVAKGSRKGSYTIRALDTFIDPLPKLFGVGQLLHQHLALAHDLLRRGEEELKVGEDLFRNRFFYTELGTSTLLHAGLLHGDRLQRREKGTRKKGEI